MSDPKRFDPLSDGMWENSAGEYVLHSDYARLKAEVERYKFTLEEERQITRQDWAGLRCEHDRVKRALEQAEAEVERLTNENGNNSVMKEEWYLKCMSARAEVESVRQVAQDNKTETEVARIENARLKAEVERLTDALNKLVKTPPEATGGVRVKVDFWTQYGSRLPSSYETFWENAAKEGKQS